MPGRRTLAIVALLAVSALCVATMEIRTHETGDAYYRFLVWNLILAWVPLVLAMVAYGRARRRVDLTVAVLLVPWLLFFPNAPYLLTDFIHLGEGPAPLWYDALMLSAFAWTGLMLGFASLYLVQMILRRAFGTVVAWLGVVVALSLGSIGVYVGRFIRFNSWDATSSFRRYRHGRPRRCSRWSPFSSSATSSSTASPRSSSSSTGTSRAAHVVERAVPRLASGA